MAPSVVPFPRGWERVSIQALGSGGAEETGRRAQVAERRGKERLLGLETVCGPMSEADYTAEGRKKSMTSSSHPETLHRRQHCLVTGAVRALHNLAQLSFVLPYPTKTEHPVVIKFPELLRERSTFSLRVVLGDRNQCHVD